MDEKSKSCSKCKKRPVPDLIYIQFFAEQFLLIEEITKLDRDLISQKIPRLNTIMPIAFGIITAGKSMATLLVDGNITEAYIMARTFLERITNLSYLLICQEDIFKTFKNHSYQKIYRSIVTKWESFNLMDYELQKPKPSNFPPDMQEAIDEFTSRRGKEITRWTNEPLAKRFDAIHSKCPKFFKDKYILLTQFIYEDASEAAHGTLYGSLFHTGYIYGRATNDEIIKYAVDNANNLCFFTGLLVEDLFHVLVSFDFDNKVLNDLLDKSKSSFNKLGDKIPKDDEELLKSLKRPT